MQHVSAPQRLYFFSDVYGGSNQNPTKHDSIEELITTDCRCPIFHTAPIKREFDIHYQPTCTDHILRTVIELHDEAMQRTDWTKEQKEQFVQQGTGVFINLAPRISAHNGETPFIIATARAGAIRIVCTGFSILSAIKHEIETLEYLPNPNPGAQDAVYSLDAESNGLYTWQQQFRSSFTPQLLDPNHGYATKLLDVDHVPDYTKGWHIAYIDRYGNVITWAPNADEVLTKVTSVLSTDKNVTLRIGSQEQVLALEVPSSLGAATPGAHILYKNGQNIEITRKWLKTDTPVERIEKSGYYLLNEPEFGSELSVV